MSCWLDGFRGEIALSLSSSKNRNPTELVQNQPLALGCINTCLGWPKRKQSGKINFLNPANSIPNTLCACMKGLDSVYVWTLNLRNYMDTCSLCVSTHFRVYLIYTHAHIYLESFWERPIQGLCKVSFHSATDVVQGRQRVWAQGENDVVWAFLSFLFCPGCWRECLSRAGDYGFA